MSSIYEQIASLPPEKRELFEMMLMEQGVDLSQIMIVPQKRDGKPFPLSYSQQRLWFLDQMEPGSPLYNIPSALRVHGRLDADALRRSFNEIIRRHEVLRTTFATENDQPVQIIADKLEIDVPVIPVEEDNPQKAEEAVHRLAVEEALQPFDLQKGPLLRVKLLRLKEDDHVMLVTMHHIVSDNWSTGLFVHEFLQLYPAFAAGKPSPLPDPAVQYADFAFWQRKWLSGKTLENQVSYWREKLAGLPPVLDLPTDRPRPAYQTYNGDYITFPIDGKLTEHLQELARKEDVTPFMILLAAFDILLAKYSGQEDIPVGTPVANRNRSETENMIGFFVNTLVLRADLSGNPSFTALLKQVKEATLGALAHQDVPFETLVEALQPERDMSHPPLFQVMFVLNNAPVAELELPGLRFELMEIENKTAKFEIILNITERKDGLSGKLEFNTDLYNRETMQRLIEHYLRLLEAAVKNPGAPLSELDILSEEEKNVLLELARPPRIYNESLCIHNMFEQTAKKTPAAVALRVADEALTYETLNKQANQLAHYLLQNGLQCGQFVGVCAERSSGMLVSLLAVLKAGGIYLPLDPNYPADRLNYMLEDSGADFLITQEKFVSTFSTDRRNVVLLDGHREKIEAGESTNPEVKLNGDDPAYIIYTSGSTGKPKGVIVQHQAIADHCADMRDHYKLTAEDNVLQFAALNFDASLEQILPPLITGATVVMREEEIWPPADFHRKVEEYDLTVINPPTAYWAQLAGEWAAHPERVPHNRVRLVIVGGDRMRSDALEKWQRTAMKDVPLLNAYGPTETVITASTYEIPPDFDAPSLPIGRQRANREFYVVDRHLKLVPRGIPGELLIGGSALARGYHNRPDLTGERFIANPFGKGRVYRTGDLVKWNADGQLEFLGRVDQQVKIRGFRIELGEIESLLQSHEAVKEAVVAAKEDEEGEKKLVAYYVAAGDSAPTAQELRDFLKKELPDYMVPAIYMPLDTMPLSPAGKINRNALPEPESLRAQIQTEYVAPRTPSEEKLAEMVKEVLKIEKVGVFDNFFELGGHSMMATQVVSRIRDEFDVELSLRTLFENPTIDGIARAITEEQAAMQDEEELEKMLDELEGLSDEEIKRMLEDE
ncbi:MAG TPA: amino acid adenylation domain-containing protein [Caldithrix abyssi]|uniref:Amino acid adenylation domain-containing protein n=1 Tax=Caldithrix abyssi TaxID=187145 RepID=A0A7V4WUD9_CALAY|nr:amino acid adenylation domain-containing protein [Caldithrix abyssi]